MCALVTVSCVSVTVFRVCGLVLDLELEVCRVSRVRFARVPCPSTEVEICERQVVQCTGKKISL